MATEISIDVTRLVARALRGRLPTGVDRVCLNYIRRYRDARMVIRRAGWGKVLAQGDSQSLASLLLSCSEDLRSRLYKLLIQSLARRTLPLASGSIFFNVGHSGLDHGAYVRWLRQSQLQPVLMIHDLIPITHPEYCRQGEKQRHAQRIAAMLDCGAALVTNSLFTQRVLQNYMDTHGLRARPSAVAPLGGSPLQIGAGEPILKEPYFVMVGTIEPRKNHASMLQCWRRLSELWRDGPVPRLVIIGQQGWNVEHVNSLLRLCDACRSLVLVRSDCNDMELATWLRHARAMLFPSFVEGYGLPLVEALAHGTPVIASDLDVFHEVAGDIPNYLDPLDGLGWLKAIIEFARQDSPRRRAQQDRMRYFVPPDWTRHFDIVDGLLENLQGMQP